MAGAVLQAAVVVGLAAPRQLNAQQPPARPPQPPPDTTRRDSVRVTVPAAGQRADSGRAARIDSVQGVPDTLKTRVRRDSIQAPIVRSEVPTLIGVGRLYRWTRDSVYTTGAINLTDILERVPGLTIFRSGFLASAQTAAYLGDPSRVRVFRDGIELDVLDPRAGGVRDLGDIQLENVGEIVVERAAEEVRVHIRTWSTRSTTAYTRVDAYTGDEDTNLYRFFFGQRFGSGFDAELGVQQFGTGTRNRRTGGGGSILDAQARVGWAKKRWSVDLVYSRLDRDRDLTTTFADQDSVLPPYDSRRNDAYARIGYRSPDSAGLWLQAIAATTDFRLNGTSQQRIVDSLGRLAAGTLVRDTVLIPDSSASRRQYFLSGGYTFGRLTVSGTGRMRVFGGSSYFSPSARASFSTPLLSLTAFAERDAVGGYEVDLASSNERIYSVRNVTQNGVTRVVTDSVRSGLPIGIARPVSRTSREDVSARFAPLRWLNVLASITHESRRLNTVVQDSALAIDTVTAANDRLTTRLEGAVRVGRVWLTGGVVRRDAAVLLTPRIYEGFFVTDEGPRTQPTTVVDPTATGTVVGATGRYYKDVYLDLAGTAWSEGGPYRPQYQLRAETGVETNWLRRFPSGNFGFKFALIDEYRSRVYFPTVGDDSSVERLFTPPTNVLNVQLEIRIQTGTLTYQLRNALNRRYELVPGLTMPGPINYYGVRWTFFN